MNALFLRSGLLLGLFALSLPAGAEVYRCGPPGQLTYTDRPCADGAPLQLAPPVVVEPEDAGLARAYDRRVSEGRRRRDSADAAWLEQHQAQREREDSIRSARIAGAAVEGMSAAEVRQALGEPDKLTTGDGGERWTYRLDGGARRTLTFREGTVVAVAETTRRKRRARQAPP